MSVIDIINRIGARVREREREYSSFRSRKLEKSRINLVNSRKTLNNFS